MPATRSAKEIMDSLNVIFFTPTNMMTGAGVENVFAEYILNKPDWVRVKVIQGDFLPGERMDRVIMERLNGLADFETWHVPVEKFDRFSTHFGILRNFVFTMLLKIVWAPRHREEILNAVKGYDCIYLYGNWWSSIFPKGIVMIGTQHTDFGYTKGSFISSLKVFLIRVNLLYKNVSGFHLFPQNAELMHLLKHGNNFLLPPMGIDFDGFHIGTRAGKAKFLYVSRLEECKGILFILSLWKELNPDGELYVIGTGGLDEQVREEARGISGIKFIGRASRTELVETYSKCDVFLAPTTCDNFPIVVEEALASGMHVIASDKLRGTFDPFSHEGYLSYLPLNREFWKTEILQRIENISEVRKISSDIREFARGKFDSSEVSKEFFYQVAKLVERAKRGKISDGKDQS